MKSRRDIYVMYLRPVPAGKDKYGRDPMYRMKGFLKGMFRKFGWRCISLRPKSPDERQDEPKAGQAGTRNSVRLTPSDNKGTGLPPV